MSSFRNTLNRTVIAVGVIGLTYTVLANPASASRSTTTPSAAAVNSVPTSVTTPLNTHRGDSWYSEARNTKSCPRKAPDNTLRGKAAKQTLKKICSSSLKKAATPFAAYAVKYALRNLGVEYVEEGHEVEQRDDADRYDCSSYVSRAYLNADIDTTIKDKGAERGWRFPVTTEIRDSVNWTAEVSAREAAPGDLVVYYTGAGGQGHHVVMLLSNKLMAHVNDYGEVTHVTDFEPGTLTNPVYLRVVDNS